MYHEEILAQAGDYRAGRLGPGEKAAMDRHLQRCRDCRLIVGRWKAVNPPGDFADRIMGSVSPASGRPAGTGWARRLPLWGTVAAAVLAGAAFWHPEKQWVDQDRSFDWNSRPALSAARPCAPVSNRERGLP